MNRDGTAHAEAGPRNPERADDAEVSGSRPCPTPAGAAWGTAAGNGDPATNAFPASCAPFRIRGCRTAPRTCPGEVATVASWSARNGARPVAGAFVEASGDLTPVPPPVTPHGLGVQSGYSG